MMPGRILRLFSIAIAKHKGHTLTFSMSVVLPDRSRESPFVLSSVSWPSALSVANTGSGETLVFRVATIIHHALTCFARSCRRVDRKVSAKAAVSVWPVALREIFLSAPLLSLCQSVKLE